jgi:hypothetical protein
MRELEDHTPPTTLVDPSPETGDPALEPEDPGIPNDLRMLGRFEILRELGRGGMGRVFKAWDPARREQVAIKVLLGISSASMYRFKREFRSLAEVAHPNLVRLHELFSENGRLFFSMELLDGTDFLDWARSTADFDRLRGAMRQLADGVHALHRHGKLHRDIKPSNIAVTRDGRVVLLDFGLVREREDHGNGDMTAPGAVLGTPAYMSPEQAAGLPIGPPSDWYSVGLVLYEALTGVRPFDEPNPARLMRARIVRDPDPPSAHTLGIPEDLDTLCHGLLTREPAMRPSPSDILARLGAAAEVARLPDAASGSGSFVGRERELDLLATSLDAAAGGEAVAILLGGPSGIGKSELIRYFVSGLGGTDAPLVLSGRCHERESVPYKALDDIIDRIADRLQRLRPDERDAIVPAGIDALARVFPVLGRVASLTLGPGAGETLVDDHELRSRAFAALRDLLGRLRGRSPVVITIDDLQWADRDSVALLLELLRPPTPPPILFVFGHRSERDDGAPPLRSLIAGLRSERAAHRLHELALAPLPGEDCVRLARLLLGADRTPEQVQASAIARESQGSPLFVAELVRYAHRRRIEGTPASLAQEIPRLDDAIAARIDDLSPPARSLLEIVAVAGRPVEQGLALTAALGRDRDARALDALRDEHLVRTHGVGDRDPIEPSHERIREHLLRRLASDELRARHLALAEALAASGRADPDALATHFLHAGAGDRTVPHALQAGRGAAAALAFARAVEWFELALANLPPDDVRRCDLEAELGTAYANDSRAYEGAQAFIRAAAIAPADRRPELRRRAVHLLVSAGDLREGRELLAELLGDAGLPMPRTPRQTLLSVLWLRLRIALRGLEYVERPATQVSARDLHRIDLCWAAGYLVPYDRLLGAGFFARHLLLALRAGEPSRIAPALALEAASRFLAGGSDLEQTRELLRRADQIADRSGNSEARAWVASAKPAVFLLAGEWAQAAAHARDAAELVRRHAVGAGVSVMTSRYIELWARWQSGDWADLERPIRRLLASGGRRNPLHWNLRTLLAVPIALARDQPTEAMELFDEWAATPPEEIFGSSDIAMFAGRVAAHLYCGEGDAAWRHARTTRRPLDRALQFRDPLTHASLHLARAQAAIGHAAEVEGRDRRSAAVQARRDLHRLERTRFRPARTLARLGHAALAWIDGTPDVCEPLLRRCIDELDALDMAVHAAAARRRLGALLGGDRGEAVVRQADAALAARGVARPEAITRQFVPGFPDP